MKWKSVILIIPYALFIAAPIESAPANDNIVPPEILQKIPEEFRYLLDMEILDPLSFQDLPSGVYCVLKITETRIALLKTNERNIMYPTVGVPDKWLIVGAEFSKD